MSIINAEIKSEKSRESHKSTVQTYARFKPSGVEWLGEIPEHWEAKRLKYFGSIFSGLSGKKGDDFSKEYSNGFKEFIPFTNICNNSIISEDEYQYVKVAEDEYQNRVKNKDILFLMSSETLDEIAKTSIYLSNDDELYLNSFCKGFRIKSSTLFPEYINYLLSSDTYRKYFEVVGRGFTRINIQQDYINNVFITIPPLPEQTAIANFLDDKTQKIDQAIGIKEQQIALLKERKQILIHKAVTRGLDDAMLLKDSSVEWIGKIPEHWEVKALKFICNLQSGEFISSEDFKEEGFPVYGGNGFRAYAESYTNEGFYALIGRQGALCGNVNYAKGKFYATEHAVVVYPINSEDTLWLGETIKVADFNRLSQSAAQPGIAVGVIKNERFPYPPLSEQKEISSYIESASQKIDTAISLKTQEIERLKEYKSSLIDSVVTGKINIL